MDVMVINLDKKSKAGYTYSKEVIDDALQDSALQARLINRWFNN